MFFKKKIPGFLTLLIILGILSLYFFSCNKSSSTTFTIPPEVSYKTFQLKSDDVRLEYFRTPLYSFEYPEIFRLNDPNVNLLQGSVSYFFSLVDLTIHRNDLPEPKLRILIQKPGYLDQNNPADIIKGWISNEGKKWDAKTTRQVMISGIKADYLETSGTIAGLIRDGKQNYPDHMGSLRGMAFSYSSLIWSISMTWDYLDSEPPEIQGYFDHVVYSFKILE